MAKEEKKAPKLRFNGYTNDWERKKLGILITRVKSYPLSRSVEVKKETDVKYVHYGDIHTNIADEIDKNNNLPFINEIYKEYDELKLDDVIVADASEDYKGIADAAVIISNLPYTIIAGLHTIALRPTSLIKGYFLYHIFKTENFKRFGYKIGTGLKVFGISYNNLAKYKVYYPQEIEEQEKIIGILSNLTNSINLHEDYLQLLYDFISFLLQKMFSINDTFPNLRFKQFNDKWKYKKLGEVADIVSGGTPDTKKHDYWNGSINWYTPAEIGNKIFVSGSQRKITNIGLENSSAKILPIGTVLFTSRAGIGKTAILKEKGSTNQGFQSIVPKQKFLDSYFIFSMSNILKKYGESHGAGSTFLEISGKELAKAKISLPSITEQKHISKVLFKLDTIITFQKQEIDNLKKLKQFLLQNMFI